MLLQVRTGSKALGAQMASVRFIPRVNPFMPDHVAYLGKALLTALIPTAVRLDFVMDALVLLEG